MKFRVRQDLTGGIALAIISIIIWIMIPYNIAVRESGVNAQTFPRMIVGAIFILSIALIITALINKKNDKIIELDLKKEGVIVLYAIGLVTYIFIIGKIGFVISSLLFSFSSLRLLKARRNSYIAMTILIVFVYVMFRFVLGIPLP